jgi:uncharacterized protein YbbK (DUF523 family)
MLEHIYVVVGSGTSDIGKAWLTGSIASVLPKALPVKVDPMLNRQFPSEFGITLRGKVVSEDLSTYRDLGLPVHPECNIVAGALLYEFFRQPRKSLDHGPKQGSTKKLTFADVSAFLTDKLLSVANNLGNYRNLVIEVGGIVTDLENAYIPAALRTLGLKTGTMPEMVVLGYLEHPETHTGSPVRTQAIRYAIRETRRKYSLPIKACFVRRRYVPEQVTDEQIRDELINIAFETQLPPTRIVYVPNLSNVHELRQVVKGSGLFEDEDETCLVSACLLGIPCRYDGTSDELDPRTVSLLREKEVTVICPELLAGLPVPRGPFEIVGGDGYDVLDENARVVSSDGDDYTEQFIHGAQRALDIAKRMKITRAILYHRSPSCGCLQIYDGSFEHRLRSGYGVSAALLDRSGIRCIPNTKM